jgi:hypothetical protein
MSMPSSTSAMSVLLLCLARLFSSLDPEPIRT